MRKLGIDYGENRTGLSITDALNMTVQGLETIKSNGNDILNYGDTYIIPRKMKMHYHCLNYNA